jgi:flagellar motor switch protein FliN
LISDKFVSQVKLFDTEVNSRCIQWLEKTYKAQVVLSIDKIVANNADEIKTAVGIKTLRVDFSVGDTGAAITYLASPDYLSETISYLEQSGEGEVAVPGSMQQLLDIAEQLATQMKQVAAEKLKKEVQIGSPSLLLWKGSDEPFLKDSFATYYIVSFGAGLSFPIVRLMPIALATSWLESVLKEKHVAEKKVFGEFKEGESNGHNLRPIEELYDLELEVGVELGRVQMLLKDILALGPGGIIELDKFAGDPVDLYVNNKKFAEGEVVVVEQNFAVRITNLISATERMSSARN